MNAHTPVAAQTSGEVLIEIDGLERERADAVAALARGESDRAAILLTGDDKKAERHDADMARHRRAIERVDLRLPALRDALADAQASEAAARDAAKRDEAEAAIAAFAKTFKAAYEDPAAKIAAFCQEWARLDDLARDAGVESPTSRFLSTVLQEEQPARYRDELYETYLDEFGRETTISHGTNPEGLRRQQDGDKYLRRKVTRTRRVLVAARVAAIYDSATALPKAVSLPAIAVRGTAFWMPRSE